MFTLTIAIASTATIASLVVGALAAYLPGRTVRFSRTQLEADQDELHAHIAQIRAALVK